MSDTNGQGSCALMSWGLAALAGLLGFVLLLMLGDWRVIQAIFAAIVICVVLGAVLSWLLCKPLPAPGGAARRSSAKPASPGQPETAPPPAPAAAAPAPAPEPKAEPAPAPEPAPEPKATPAPPAGESAAPAAQPKMMTEAPEGGADDLKQIKGIGPKLEQLCNSLGIYTFAQIADWTDEEVAWVDDNLEGFKGRVTRDDWVAQAKALAEGDAT